MLSPPEETFGNEVLKITSHEVDESIWALVQRKTARSTVFAKDLPSDPGVIRFEDGVVREFSAGRTISDPHDSKS
jgi:hypothetical protein